MSTKAGELHGVILWAMLYAPHAWPLCSGLGTLLVVFNNFFVWRLALDATEELENRQSVRARDDAEATPTAANGRPLFSTYIDGGWEFTKEFREWFALMAAYSLSMSLIWVLLFFGVAHDEAVYAYLICWINVFKMYRLNCVGRAPYARGNTERTITTLRRAQALRDADSKHETEHDPSIRVGEDHGIASHAFRPSAQPRGEVRRSPAPRASA